MAYQNNRQSRAPPNQQMSRQKQSVQPRRQAQKRVAPQQLLKPKIMKITAVQIEGLVLLKIIKHCGEHLAQRQAVSGKLLGLPTDENTVEITNCFPVPTTQFTESDESSADSEKKQQRAQKKADKYANDMIRLMSRVREDNLRVGFYRSALNGSFLSCKTISAAYKHQQQSSASVTIIYDPTATVRGRLVVRAFRLTNSFMEFYAVNDFGPTSIAKYDLSAKDIFEELKVKIHNSHLVHAFLYEIAQLPPHKSLTNGFDRLHHSHNNSLMINLKQLSSSIDVYAEKTQEFRNYWSKSSKNKNKREEFIAKFKQQNAQLASIGQKKRPLPEIDRLFPAEKEPDRIESVTLTAQMNEYCKEVDTTIMQGLVKLWLTQGIHAHDVIQ